jgi:hypothetical protein
MGIVIRSAWGTIAEPILSRSLPLVVYTPRGGTEKSALKGCLPELKDVRLLTDVVIILFFYKVFYKGKY